MMTRKPVLSCFVLWAGFWLSLSSWSSSFASGSQCGQLFDEFADEGIWSFVIAPTHSGNEANTLQACKHNNYTKLSTAMKDNATCGIDRMSDAISLCMNHTDTVHTCELVLTGHHMILDAFTQGLHVIGDDSEHSVMHVKLVSVLYSYWITADTENIKEEIKNGSSSVAAKYYPRVTMSEDVESEHGNVTWAYMENALTYSVTMAGIVFDGSMWTGVFDTLSCLHLHHMSFTEMNGTGLALAVYDVNTVHLGRINITNINS